MYVYNFLVLFMCKYFKFSFGTSVTNGIFFKTESMQHFVHQSHVTVLNYFGCMHQSSVQFSSVYFCHFNYMYIYIYINIQIMKFEIKWRGSS